MLKLRYCCWAAKAMVRGEGMKGGMRGELGAEVGPKGLFGDCCCFPTEFERFMRNAEDEDDDDENEEVFEDPLDEGEDRGCLLSTVFTVTVVPAGMFRVRVSVLLTSVSEPALGKLFL